MKIRIEWTKRECEAIYRMYSILDPQNSAKNKAESFLKEFTENESTEDVISQVTYEPDCEGRALSMYMDAKEGFIIDLLDRGSAVINVIFNASKSLIPMLKSIGYIYRKAMPVNLESYARNALNRDSKYKFAISYLNDEYVPYCVCAETPIAVSELYNELIGDKNIVKYTIGFKNNDDVYFYKSIKEFIVYLGID